MNTLDAETDIESTVQAREAVEIIDCVRASERTNGMTLMLLFELGTPPNKKMFFF